MNQATVKGYIELIPGGIADVSYPKSKLRRGRVQEQGTVSPTVTCAVENSLMKIDWSKEMDLFGNEEKTKEDAVEHANNLASGYRIRKLTPKECLRLMAVRDEDSDKMLEVNSNSQCYKQAGNSIVVSVMEAMFRNLNIKGVKTWDEVKKDYDPYDKIIKKA